MALVDTATVFAPAPSSLRSRRPGRLLMTLLGNLTVHRRSGSPTAAGSADQLRRDPAGLVGRDVERWLDLMLRHRL